MPHRAQRLAAFPCLSNLCILIASLGACPSLAVSREQAEQPDYDVVVIGGTPGGISSAITAARLGHKTAIVEYHAHLGGMTTAGLGKTDVETPAALGGLFREFIDRVYADYVERYGADSENVKLCREGYYYEPSVAERILDRMVADEPLITVLRLHRLKEVFRTGNAVTGVRLLNRTDETNVDLRGRVFIDATYEGDLAAFAGAKYRLGREGRHEFNELHAGVVYQDYENRSFQAGTTGEGDKRLPAYTYRLCLTSDPANAARLTSPPPDYDRTRYLGYVDDWKSGRFDAPAKMIEGVGYYMPTFGTIVRALSLADIPNRKLDCNMNPRPLGFVFPEENYDYPEANWERREEISNHIRNLTLGLLYFMQNDELIPAEHRELANRFHLPKDEFTDNDHFPFQLYVREARRIVGLYTLSERDVIVGPELRRPPIHADAIAAGEYPIDSFPVRKREPGHEKGLEGYIFMQKDMTRPYHIPYRILVPETVDGLLVPVAASTTHVAFSSIRLEPTWMALGQAAGAAAHLAITNKQQPRDVDVQQLQWLLLDGGQVLTYFEDLDRNDPNFRALQYFGTKGFFPDYDARADDPITQADAESWAKQAGRTETPPIAAGTTRGEFCRLLFTQP